MQNLKDLKEQIRKALPELDVVIGWTGGYDPLHATPHFIRRDEDIDKLQVGALCVHNLATYLPGLRGKKVGIVVKGCDSRSVVELLQEKLIDREDVTIFGFGCSGVVDQTKIRRIVGDVGNIDSCEISGSEVNVSASGAEHKLQLGDVLADKCTTCRYPNAVLSDHFAGEEVTATATFEDGYKDVAEFEAKPTNEKFGFWLKEMDRCIRCYACRNACPICVCRDHCVAQSRDPHWLSQEAHVRDKWMFQVIHAYHLAGRCTECGECQRACPVDIPILLFKKKMNKEIKDVFDYEAGIDPEATPPLMTFKTEEDKIKERKW
ncbi:4Fe-4S dicluster domain-containing protein [Desulfovibrio gilichinskyi]|uniref:4Fe-4S dicluster domain-containing protein n=1 Tax=Desulfovibrio gilichinskyi TaxID=1519643 RepID=A0A1X7CNL7_9BACT|nr:4Fe-4S dicluster domain-containing protein [Desulfovibrio gilichinskyi]SMF00018.1 4Fe-4S dicluster domain-containing protein [Desulfovibrio gilichinskyi]